MRGIEGGVLLAVVVGAVASDFYLVFSRCVASPGIGWTEVLFGALLQAAAVSVPLLVGAQLSAHPPAYRLKISSLGLLLLLFSLPLLQYGVLYSDAIGKEKGYRSVGLHCRAPLV
jgi:hypothetical protein